MLSDSGFKPLAGTPDDVGDRLDKPEKILRLAIREMEVSIAEATFETARAMASARTLRRQWELSRKECEQWHARAVVAVEAGDEPSARTALWRKREQDRMAVMLGQQAEAAGQASVALRQHLDKLRGKLAEARQRLASVLARQEAVESYRWAGTSATELHGEDGDVVSFGFHARERRGQGDGKPQAMTGIEHVGSTCAADEVAPQEDRDVSAELMELKRQLGK